MSHCPVCGTHLPKRKTGMWPLLAFVPAIPAGFVAYNWVTPETVHPVEITAVSNIEEIPIPRVTGTTFKIKPKKPRKPRTSLIRRPAPHILNY